MIYRIRIEELDHERNLLRQSVHDIPQSLLTESKLSEEEVFSIVAAQAYNQLKKHKEKSNQYEKNISSPFN